MRSETVAKTDEQADKSRVRLFARDPRRPTTLSALAQAIGNQKPETPRLGQENVTWARSFSSATSRSTTSGPDLEALFAAAGTVESATVINDRDTGRSRGFGFVEMSSSTEAAKAIAELNGRDVAGRQINVSEAKEQSRGGGGNRRAGGGGGYGGNSRY